MDFGFSQEQGMLRESARDFLSRECTMPYVREMMENERGFSEAQWRQLAELGWTGIAIAEAYGGLGLGMVDLVVVLEEMGHVVLPGPFFASAVLGTAAITLAGTAEQKERHLPGLAAGSVRATVAQLEPGRGWDAGGIALRAVRDGSEYRLSGTKVFVHDAHNADLLVVPVRTGENGAEGVTCLLVDRGAKGIAIRVLKTMDQTRKLCEVCFDDVRVAAADVLGEPGQGWPLVERLMDRGRVGLCAEMCGGAQRVLEMSVEYAKVREQFGRPIGSFQAIQHKCADMLVGVESARSATYYAAAALADESLDAHLAACMAKAYCSDAYRRVSADGIQVHGGIGFTWEHDMHIYFKRAKGSEITFGDAAWNRELVAREVLDRPVPAPPP